MTPDEIREYKQYIGKEQTDPENGRLFRMVFGHKVYQIGDDKLDEAINLDRVRLYIKNANA